MSRRKKINKREIEPDPRYKDKTISKFSSMAGERLEELLSSELTPTTEDNLKKTKDSLAELNALESFSSSEKSISPLNYSIYLIA